MNAAIRCAVYTRTATTEALDNGVDAQRFAAERFIESCESWVGLSDRYDDRGKSGLDMARPALQRLLADVRKGSVDRIVVRDVSRVTRSLTQLHRLNGIFDAHGVVLVSLDTDAGRKGGAR